MNVGLPHLVAVEHDLVAEADRVDGALASALRALRAGRSLQSNGDRVLHIAKGYRSLLSCGSLVVPVAEMVLVGLTVGALPHVLDMEWTPHSKTCRLRPDGATVRAEAKRFLDILERHYGRRPIVYTTVDFHADTNIARLRGTEFWLRSVAGHPHKVYPKSPWRFWQYTGTGLVPGVEGPVDINTFNGHPETWVRWVGNAP